MSILDYAPLLILGISFGWVLVQTIIAFLGLQVSENFIKVNTGLYCISLVILNIITLVVVRLKGHSYLIHLPDLLSIRNYTLTAELFVDTTGVIFATLAAFLFGIISRFSFSYLHREEGFYRYFLLITLLSLGVQFISYAGSLDIFFIGWELVGITSVHLIAFFQTNLRSAQNSLRALVSYRVCDMALLVACVLLHFYNHGTGFHDIQHHATESVTHWVGLFIIIATLAKSAQFPLSNWLFRAMEGPTTSSAIYYGALSVHLGPFLLLRTESLWSIWPGLRATIFLIGLISSIYASLVGKTRSDVKSSIAYTTITQVGMIYMELALGLHTLAITHILCHALLRTWQFLRSSSVIHDFLESATTREQFELIMYYPEHPVPNWRKNLYIHAMNGFYLDQIQNFLFVLPFKGISSFLKKYEFSLSLATSLLVLVSVLPYSMIDKTALVWLILLFSMIFSLIGFSSKLLHAFVYILISQALFCYAGFTIDGLGRVASYIQLTSLLFTAPILLYLGLKIEKAKGQKPETYLGLFHHFPKMSLCILLAGWILVGVPGGPIQISEDMLSYDLIRVSPLTIIFFAICAFTNFIVFYSQYAKTFYGPLDHYRVLLNEEVIPGKDIGYLRYALVGAIIFLLFTVGIFPRLMFLS